MPLTRPIAKSALATPRGVQFFLADRRKLVRCLITNAALEKLVGHALTIEKFESAFGAHRERIETTASHKYDASRAHYPPLILTPADLVAYRRPLHQSPA
jgi:Protein of unknown function (DUF1488)